MKSPLALTLLISFSNIFANDKLDYSIKIGDAYSSEKSLTDIVIEAVNKGVFKPNDYILRRDGNGTDGTLGSTFAQTYQYITDPNFLYVNSENARGLKFLLDKGLDPNQLTNDDQYNLLISAAQSCNLEAVKLLINKGVNPLLNVPDKVFSTVTTREQNGAGAASDSHFNYITQDLSIEEDACFNTFKYFVEVVGVDIKNHGCLSFSFPEPTTNKASVRYFNYMNTKFGANFSSDCEKSDTEQMKKAGF